MQRIVVAAMVAFSLALAGAAVAAEKTVIVPVGNKVEVSEKDTIRIPVKGIAGTKIEVTVTGDAKVESETNVVERAGGRPVIGNTIKEFEIKPTGKGKATIKVSVTPPTGGATVKEIEVEIK
jgi:hypothetical protein